VLAARRFNPGAQRPDVHFGGGLTVETDGSQFLELKNIAVVSLRSINELEQLRLWPDRCYRPVAWRSGRRARSHESSTGSDGGIPPHRLGCPW
jgi:hypothetical protein